jgi:uncharacterized protein
MDAKIVAEIKAKLDQVCLEETVAIPLAIESGSRAWGFPSPDSDYDCRFIYLRGLKHNTALFPPRDVIELPFTPIFDVNGWDLRKAIKLLLKGNAVVLRAEACIGLAADARATPRSLSRHENPRHR